MRSDQAVFISVFFGIPAPDVGDLGFPFALGSTQWLVWITPKTAFLEGVAVSERITQTIHGQQVRGFAKASTAVAGPEGGGFGQWLIVR